MTFDLPPSPFNMAAYVLARAPQVPDKIALAVLGPARATRWSFARLEAAIRGAATGLLNSGLVAGDRVLLRLGNSPDFPIAFLACLAVDVIPVPTSPQLTRAEITKIAAQIAPKQIISDGETTLPDHSAPILTTQRLQHFYNLPPAQYVLGDPDREGYIIFTSGTSGTARGVVHAHRAIWARRMMHDGWYGLTKEDRILHAGAFNWTYTLGTGLMDPWSVGATALIPAPDTATDMVPLLLKRHDASIFAAAPGVYRQMLRRPIAPLPRLRHGLSAGEKLPETTRTAWQDATGTPIYEAYGMSECSTFISASPSAQAEAGTLGRPQPGRRVVLLDDQASTQTTLQTDPQASTSASTLADSGEIAIHRSDPGLMLGYLDAPDDTAARFSGAYFRTGDLATRTLSGHIRYEGRVDDMMNAGGFRVSPIEVEAAMARHSAIHDTAAVELAVKSDASVIAVFYVADNVIDDNELSAHAARQLARYKCPRLFIRVDHLPRGANNKLLRRQLRQDWNLRHGQT